MISEFLWTWLKFLGWCVVIVIISCILFGVLWVGGALGGPIGLFITAVVLITGTMALIETLD